MYMHVPYSWVRLEVVPEVCKLAQENELLKCFWTILIASYLMAHRELSRSCLCHAIWY